jgi:peptide/nickel transport system permease protein
VKAIRGISWAVLGVALLVSLAPGWVSLYPAAEQHRDYPYVKPGVYGDAHLQWFSHGRLLAVEGAGGVFPLGTDEFGRDVYSRICYGASLSLLLAPAAVLFSLSVAMLLGTWAGYRLGWADALVTKASEVFLALPWFYFVVALRAALPLRMSPQTAALTLFGLLGGLGWAGPARLFRGLTLKLMTEDFVQAARALGARPRRVVLVHLLPALLPAARAQLLLSLPAYILTEVNLSFLGLGITDPTPTLGNLLTPLQQYSVLTSYPWMLAPAAVIVLVFLALHTVAG